MNYWIKLTQNYNPMKKYILTTIMFFTIYTIYSNNTRQSFETEYALNSVYFSVGGAGIYNSLNYERTLIFTDKYSAGVKIGVGSSFSAVLFPNEFTVPVGAYFLFGKNNSHIDFSFCATNYILEQYNYSDNKNYKELKLLLVPSLAYRYKKSEGGFIGRIGFSPIINIDKKRNPAAPWFDVSIGWAF